MVFHRANERPDEEKEDANVAGMTEGEIAEVGDESPR